MKVAVFRKDEMGNVNLDGKPEYYGEHLKWVEDKIGVNNYISSLVQKPDGSIDVVRREHIKVLTDGDVVLKPTIDVDELNFKVQPEILSKLKKLLMIVEEAHYDKCKVEDIYYILDDIITELTTSNANIIENTTNKEDHGDVNNVVCEETKGIPKENYDNMTSFSVIHSELNEKTYEEFMESYIKYVRQTCKNKESASDFTGISVYRINKLLRLYGCGY
jgi:uncharacterized protein YqfB (UPF0267 family)